MRARSSCGDRGAPEAESFAFTKLEKIFADFFPQRPVTPAPREKSRESLASDSVTDGAQGDERRARRPLATRR
jgi:hypothetical protein